MRLLSRTTQERSTLLRPFQTALPPPTPAPAIDVALPPPPPIPPPVIIPEDVQNSLIENLVVRLTKMGFGPNQPPQQTGTSLPQASEPEHEASDSGRQGTDWDQT